MQPAPNIGREVTPDNQFVLDVLYFGQNHDNAIKSSSQHSRKDDGLYMGLSPLEPQKSYRNPTVDIASSPGVQTDQLPSRQTPSVDYLAAMTIGAQRPPYVPPSNQAQYD